MWLSTMNEHRAIYSANLLQLYIYICVDYQSSRNRNYKSSYRDLHVLSGNISQPFPDASPSRLIIQRQECGTTWQAPIVLYQKNNKSEINTYREDPTEVPNPILGITDLCCRSADFCLQISVGLENVKCCDSNTLNPDDQIYNFTHL